jgi:hypothetical protein
MRGASGGMPFAVAVMVLLAIASTFVAEIIHYSKYHDWFGYGLHVDVTNLQVHIADIRAITTIDVDVRNFSIHPVVLPGPTRTDHAAFLSMQPSRTFRFRIEEWDNRRSKWKPVVHIAQDSFWYLIISRTLWFRAMRSSGLYLSNWNELRHPGTPGARFRSIAETLDKTGRIESTMYSAMVESPQIHYRQP